MALQHWIKFDEDSGGSYADSVGGLSFTPSLVGSTVNPTTGQNSNALLKEANERWDSASGSMMDFGRADTQDWTIGFWINWTGATTSGAYPICYSTGGGDGFRVAFASDAFRVRVRIDDGTSGDNLTVANANGGASIAGQGWIHFLLVYTASTRTIECFEDGVSIGTSAQYAATGDISAAAGASNVTIGTWHANTNQAAGEYAIDDIRIFNHALSGSEITDEASSAYIVPEVEPTPVTTKDSPLQAIHQWKFNDDLTDTGSTGGGDLEQYDSAGTSVITSRFEASGKFDQSGDLNSDEHYRIEGNPGTNPISAFSDLQKWSACGWCKLGVVNTNVYLMSHVNSSFTQGWDIRFNSTAAFMYFELDDGTTSITGGSGLLGGFTSIEDDDTWHFWAVSVDRVNGQVVGYLDNVEIGSLDISTVTGNLANSSYPFNIGTYGNRAANDQNDWSMDNVRVFDFVLEPGHVEMLYNEGVAVDRFPACYNLKQLQDLTGHRILMVGDSYMAPQADRFTYQLLESLNVGDITAYSVGALASELNLAPSLSTSGATVSQTNPSSDYSVFDGTEYFGLPLGGHWQWHLDGSGTYGTWGRIVAIADEDNFPILKGDVGNTWDFPRAATVNARLLYYCPASLTDLTDREYQLNDRSAGASHELAAIQFTADARRFLADDEGDPDVATRGAPKLSNINAVFPDMLLDNPNTAYQVAIYDKALYDAQTSGSAIPNDDKYLSVAGMVYYKTVNDGAYVQRINENSWSIEGHGYDHPSAAGDLGDEQKRYSREVLQNYLDVTTLDAAQDILVILNVAKQWDIQSTPITASLVKSAVEQFITKYTTAISNCGLPAPKFLFMHPNPGTTTGFTDEEDLEHHRKMGEGIYQACLNKQNCSYYSAHRFRGDILHSGQAESVTYIDQDAFNFFTGGSITVATDMTGRNLVNDGGDPADIIHPTDETSAAWFAAPLTTLVTAATDEVFTTGGNFTDNHFDGVLDSHLFVGCPIPGLD